MWSNPVHKLSPNIENIFLNKTLKSAWESASNIYMPEAWIRHAYNIYYNYIKTKSIIFYLINIL